MSWSAGTFRHATRISRLESSFIGHSLYSISFFNLLPASTTVYSTCSTIFHVYFSKHAH